MTTFLLIIMALLLIATLERNHRRQPPQPPSLNGSNDHDDRDWARTKLDLLALGGQAVPFTHKPMAVKRPGPTSTGRSRGAPKPTQPPWNTNHRNGPRAA